MIIPLIDNNTIWYIRRPQRAVIRVKDEKNTSVSIHFNGPRYISKRIVQKLQYAPGSVGKYQHRGARESVTPPITTPKGAPAKPWYLYLPKN